MGNNSVKNHFFEKLNKGLLHRFIRNVIYHIQNSTGYNWPGCKWTKSKGEMNEVIFANGLIG